MSGVPWLPDGFTDVFDSTPSASARWSCTPCRVAPGSPSSASPEPTDKANASLTSSGPVTEQLDSAVLPDCGHYVPEEHPDALLEHLLPFLHH
ncbi:alpha/beta fold hydrolase [Streptomyces sp. C10]|uniref:alpha/beta fold hydrolase n=1 Tax=Streptomyces sp. C10 TaxID=531941 RepID=UPI00397F14BC